MRRTGLIVTLAIVLAASMHAQGGRGRGRGGAPAADAPVTILKPARVFDGESMHEGWAVRVQGDRIEAVGANIDTSGGTVDRHARRDADAGDGGRALARPAPSLQ